MEKKNNQVIDKNKKPTLKEIKKKQAKLDTQKFKSKYFDYYDDIKISDRQDWWGKIWLNT